MLASGLTASSYLTCYVCICAAPIYLEDVTLITRSYALAGHSEGATRKFAILSTHRAAGRSSEVVWKIWDGMQWDNEYAQHSSVPPPRNERYMLHGSEDREGLAPSTFHGNKHTNTFSCE